MSGLDPLSGLAMVSTLAANGWVSPGGVRAGEGDDSGDHPAAPPGSGLAAALKEEAGIEDGRLPGAYKDEGDGHAGRPWRSHFRREGFKLKGGRHPSHADAALRILEAYQAHPAYVTTGRFMLAAGKHVDAAQLALLVEAARADAGR